jgi:hypothetical protein
MIQVKMMDATTANSKQTQIPLNQEALISIVVVAVILNNKNNKR